MTGRRVAVVAVVGLLLVGSIGGAAQQSPGGAQPTPQTAPPTDSYVVEQGSFCEPIEPVSSGETIESFYDYRSHETHRDADDTDRAYSSYGTTELQRDDTSVLFLHEGPNGTSLGTVHDRLEGETTGGLLTLEFVGLPHDNEWAVRDDNYTGETRMDEFDRGDGWASASWAYREGRTDGGAIRGGLDDAFAVTVRPAFNDDAEFASAEWAASDDSELYDGGEIDEWEIVGGSAESPERTTLPSLEEPVTVRTGTCDDPSITYDRTDGGLVATVDGAASDDRIALQPTTGTDDGVRFERVELTGVEGNASVGFESRFSELSGSSPEGVEPLSYLTIDASETGNASATVTATVEKDRLEEHNLEPEEVTLYEYDRDGDEWTETETSISDESEDAYRFTAETTSASTVAVVPDRGSDTTPSGLYGIGVGIAAGTVLGLGWLVTARVRNR